MPFSTVTEQIALLGRLVLSDEEHYKIIQDIIRILKAIERGEYARQKHWSDCWREHSQCAIKRAEELDDKVKRMRGAAQKALLQLDDEMRNTFAAQEVLDAALKNEWSRVDAIGEESKAGNPEPREPYCASCAEYGTTACSVCANGR